eukprot:Sspe_Gene.49360::Locus_26530_Transcript_1_1_Confidence_1.000_Length_2572::g.49360::m.49360
MALTLNRRPGHDPATLVWGSASDGITRKTVSRKAKDLKPLRDPVLLKQAQQKQEMMDLEQKAHPPMKAVTLATLEASTGHSRGPASISDTPVLLKLPYPKKLEVQPIKGESRHLVDALVRDAAPTPTCSTERQGEHSSTSYGFEGFEASLRSVLQKIVSKYGEHDLQRAWIELSKWLDRFFDECDFKTTAKAAGGFLEDIFKSTQKFVSPCSPRCAAVCVVLDVLLQVAVRAESSLASVASTVRSEIHRAIFLNPPDVKELDGDELSKGSLFLKRSSVLEEELMKPYVTRKTHFQGCRMLSKKLMAQGAGIETLELRNERTTGAIEKVVKYWKNHLMHVVFNAWRKTAQMGSTEFSQLQRMESLKREIEEKDARLQKELSIAWKRAEAAETEVEELREQLAAMTEQLLSKRDEKKELMTKIAGLQEELAEERRIHAAETARLNEERRAAAKAVGEYQERLIGSSWEQNNRRQFLDLLDRDDIDSYALLEWVNQFIQRHDLYHPNMMLADYCQASRALDAYWLLLSCMSPRHVPNADLKLVLALEASEKAQRLLERAELMGISTGLQGKDLILDGCAEQHELLISTLFNRFCGVIPAEVEFGPPEEDAARRKTMTPWEIARSKSAGETNKWKAVAKQVHRNVLGKVTEVMKTGMSTALTAEERRDYDLFTRVDLDVAAELDLNVEEAEGLLRNRYRKLRKVFLHYAASDGDQGHVLTMSLDEFWRLVTDAKIIDRHFGREAMRRVFNSSNTKGDDNDLDPSEFVTALLRVAYAKFKSSEGTLSDRLHRLIEQHIIAHCCGETNEFKAQIYQPSVQAVLMKEKKALKKIYRHYAELDKSPSSSPTLAYSEFAQLAKDTG